jgi:Uma2 family endonuclease
MKLDLPTDADSVMAIVINEPQRAKEAIPPLEQGDRLTRVEFERRYEAMRDLKKAELVEGRVYMSSPVKPPHGRPHARMTTWLGVYEAATPGVASSTNTTIRFDEDNEPQPDVLLAIEPSCGGQSHVDDDGYLSGSPELLIEIASSSVSYDLQDKLHVYRRQGVREYLVWRVRDAEIDWFQLVEGSYHLLPRDAAGIVKSVVFPGLWLDTAAMLKGDLAQVFAVLHDGTASPEHITFVAALQERHP